MPPAVYYGRVLAGSGFTPSAGQMVTATIGGNICGEATTRRRPDGSVTYAIQVLAAGSPPTGGQGCGIDGERAVTFLVGGRSMQPTPTWSNAEIWPLDLSPAAGVPTLTPPSPTPTRATLTPTSATPTPTRATATPTRATLTPTSATPTRTAPTPAVNKAHLPIAARMVDLRPQGVVNSTDLALILDISSGMSESTRLGRTRLDATIEASRLLLDCMNLTSGHDRVAVLAYHLQTTVLQPLTTDRSAIEFAFGRAREELSQVPVGLVERALNSAMAELNAAPSPGAARIAVLVRVGGPGSDLGESAVTAADLIKRTGIQLRVVGIAASHEEAILRQMASEPQSVVLTDDAEALPNAFREMARALLCPAGATVPLRSGLPHAEFRTMGQWRTR